MCISHLYVYALWPKTSPDWYKSDLNFFNRYDNVDNQLKSKIEIGGIKNSLIQKININI